MGILPKIKAEDIRKNAKTDDPWDFLFLFTDKYFEMINEKPEIVQEFNDSQNVLLGFNYLYDEINNYGFIQLIANGKGQYIFNNIFIKKIRLWGAIKTCEIVEKAEILYKKYKTKLEREYTIDEFNKLCEEITDFKPLDNMFFDIMDDETKIIKMYVEKNVDEFARVI